MNIFIKRRLVSAQSLGRHQALMIQESEYIQKLLIIKREIAPFTSRYLKTHDKNARWKQHKKYKKPQNVLKVTIFLYYYGLMMAQAYGLTSSRLIDISINVH